MHVRWWTMTRDELIRRLKIVILAVATYIALC